MCQSQLPTSRGHCEGPQARLGWGRWEERVESSESCSTCVHACSQLLKQAPASSVTHCPMHPFLTSTTGVQPTARGTPANMHAQSLTSHLDSSWSVLVSPCNISTHMHMGQHFILWQYGEYHVTVMWQSCDTRIKVCKDTERTVMRQWSVWECFCLHQLRPSLTSVVKHWW